MSDTLDIISLTEAKLALNITDTSQDTELASYITAVSRRLDDLCGAVVSRLVTSEEYPGGERVIFLRYAPASRVSATTMGSVSEYDSGILTTLSAEGLTSSTSSDFYFDQKVGALHRRATWRDAKFGNQRVVVTYSPGRYATTALVDSKFKQAALIMLSHLWRREQGAGTQTFGEFQPAAPTGAVYAIPNAVQDLLADEMLPPRTG